MSKFKKKLTDTAEKVLSTRYYIGSEDWSGLCSRVASAIASNEKGHDTRLQYTDKFYSMLYDQDYLPNSPCLMNAGTPLGQLCACFVLPIEDSMEGIFDTIKHAALVNKTGGGTGFSFSRLRATGADVLSTKGVASGPVSFAKVFDSATDVIKQGGRRRGANMGVLRIDHPDILNFIHAKEKDGVLSNFNLSVAITDSFMDKVADGEQYNLIDPNSGDIVDTLNAKVVWDTIIKKAHCNGEPGILFIDAANRANPTPWLGDFEATNPCGEQWLLPYEACNLGSINLANFVNDKVIDYDRLANTVALAVRFSDNVVDVSTFPIPQIAEMTRRTRKLGIGIMGLHDMLICLEIPYDSDEGRETARTVMEFISNAALDASYDLALEKGEFPAALEDSALCVRNAALTSIQPTGTVSMIADCSSGCEPYFSVVTSKHVMDGEKFRMVNKHFERVARDEGWYTDEIMDEVERTGSVVGVEGIPGKWQKIFECAQDISVEGHIRMQSELQEHVDASISKTINMPSTATVHDVDLAYKLGWKLNCKGLTVYRDGSRSLQVLNAGEQEVDAVSNDMISHRKAELPSVLDAKRYQLKDQDGEDIYIIICFDDDKRPMEVFAKFPYDNRPDQAQKSTMWVTTCRMVSTSLRFGIPINEIIKQLDRSSGNMFDLPAQLVKLLKTFVSTTGDTLKGEPCPECPGELTFEEGCVKCHSCGYSKCS
jgi:ribonucleoside-diphosphate reductase alpha chain